MPRIRVNGESQAFESAISVEALVTLFVADTREGVAVAVNGEIISRTSWPRMEVQDGDEIEIVRAVQGG